MHKNIVNTFFLCIIKVMQMIPNKLYLAMNAVMFIAYNGSEENPVPGNVIVEYSNLNKRALEPIMQKLSSAGIVVSIKGAKGGYYMSNPDETTFRDVAEAFIARVTPEKHDFAGYDEFIDKKLIQCYESWLDSLSDTTITKLCNKAKSTGTLVGTKEPVLNFSI